MSREINVADGIQVSNPLILCGQMILDYPGGHKVIIWALKWELGWRKYQDQGDVIRGNT